VGIANGLIYFELYDKEARSTIEKHPPEWRLSIFPQLIEPD